MEQINTAQLNVTENITYENNEKIVYAETNPLDIELTEIMDEIEVNLESLSEESEQSSIYLRGLSHEVKETPIE